MPTYVVCFTLCQSRCHFYKIHLFQVGKGPYASEVSGIVKIGQTMTMVLGVKDDENKFDMMVSSDGDPLISRKRILVHIS